MDTDHNHKGWDWDSGIAAEYGLPVTKTRELLPNGSHGFDDIGEHNRLQRPGQKHERYEQK